MTEQTLQALPSDQVRFRVIDLPGDESTTSRHIMTVTAQNESGENIELALSLTVPQLVQIVKHFFWVPTVRSLWAMNMVERLLKKRWAVYTKTEAKTDETHREGCTQLDFFVQDGHRVMR